MILPELIGLHLPHFALQVVRRGRDGACVLASRDESTGRVLAVDPAVERAGIVPGMSLAQARARFCLVQAMLPRSSAERGACRRRTAVHAQVPPALDGGIRPDGGLPGELVILLPDEGLVERSRDELLGALAGVAPRIHVEAPGVLLVDPRDMRRLEADPERLGERLRACARSHGYRAALGLARGRFAARLAAMRAAPDGPVLHPADTRAFLGGLPLEVLALPRETRESMDLLGLRNLGQLQVLSERQVVDRWGAPALVAWRLANGEDRRPLRWWKPPPCEDVEVELDDVRSSEALGFALSAPLENLLAESRRRGHRPEALTVELVRSGAAPRAARVCFVLSLGPGGARHTVASLLALLRLELERKLRRNEDDRNDDNLAAAFVRARLGVGRAPSAAGSLPDLAGELADPRTTHGPGRDPELGGDLFERRREPEEALEVTLARLRARLGEQGVGRAELRSALRPEAMWRWVPLGAREAPPAGGWGTAVDVHGPDPLELLPLPARAALRLTAGGPRAIPEPAAARLRMGPCRLSGEWWDGGFDREYYLLAPERDGEATALVYFDRVGRVWMVQGEVD